MLYIQCDCQMLFKFLFLYAFKSFFPHGMQQNQECLDLRIRTDQQINIQDENRLTELQLICIGLRVTFIRDSIADEKSWMKTEIQLNNIRKFSFFLFIYLFQIISEHPNVSGKLVSEAIVSSLFPNVFKREASARRFSFSIVFAIHYFPYFVRLLHRKQKGNM